MNATIVQGSSAPVSDLAIMRKPRIRRTGQRFAGAEPVSGDLSWKLPRSHSGWISYSICRLCWQVSDMATLRQVAKFWLRTQSA